MNEYDIIKIYNQMEKELIASMRRNLKRHKEEEKNVGFKFSQWQAEKIKSLHRYKKENRTIIKAYTKGLNKEVGRLLAESYQDGKTESFLAYKRALKNGYKVEPVDIADSFFKTNSRKANTLIKVINNDLKKANNACLRRSNDIYREVIHKASMFVTNGVYTEKQAIDMAIKEFTNKGVNCIVYKNGARHTISDYTSMAIKTANQRAQLMAEGEFRKKIGEVLVVISKHGTACEICQKFEGNVYIDDVYSGGTADDGDYPLLSEAMKQGMFHPNCRHGLNTYYKGITELKPKTVEHLIDNKDENLKINYKNQELEKVNPELLNIVNDRVIEIINKYPKLQEYFSEHELRFDVSDTGIMATHGHRDDDYNFMSLYFNYRKYNNPKAIADIVKEKSASHWFMPCAENHYKDYAITHEMGHVTHFVLLREDLMKEYAKGTKMNEKELFLFEQDTVASYKREIKEIAFDMLAKSGKYTDADGYVDEWSIIAQVQNEVSEYGNSKPVEWFAEVFANAHCGKPTTVAKAMLVWLERRWK